MEMMVQTTWQAQARRLIDQYGAATLALRQQAEPAEVHAYRIAARRLLALLALWRPLIHQPGLERRLLRATATLSTLRDAQVYEARFGGKPHGMSAPRVPMLTVRLARWLDRLAQVPADFNPLPLFQMQLALSLADGLAEPGLDACAGKQRQLRHWHKLRLILKRTRYGVELLVGQGHGDPAWLVMLTAWQDRLGQLQDARQWLKRLSRKGGGGKRQRELVRLKAAMGCQLQQLDCQQAELVGLRMAMLPVV
ncbi:MULTISPECIES: CHAD domain-containing protein [Aeromonas]|uniref:CHAD domain-containing protein n=1 Tax=Aeromonas TaxID=642 RepID=UPI000A4087A7|nr:MULTISPECIES: CHAD domain-containing protein [Aeromonas]MCH7373503.1 CHAD domain-containing protein [Aeromonas sp. MR16]